MHGFVLFLLFTSEQKMFYGSTTMFGQGEQMFEM